MITRPWIRRLAFTLAVAWLPGLGQAHERAGEGPAMDEALDAESRAVVAALEAFAAAYEATDIEAIRALTLPDGHFSHFEGTFADWSWDSYAGHLAEEMPLFAETRYRLANIRPEAGNAMAFATFDWALDVVVVSDEFAGGRHPVSMAGIGTAVLWKTDTGWKLRHLHTARQRSAGAPSAGHAPAEETARPEGA